MEFSDTLPQNIPNIKDISNNLPHRNVDESNNDYTKRCKLAIKTSLLHHINADFCWNINELSVVPRNTILNRILRSCFTTKSGLCATLQDMKWYNEKQITHIRFPRCYHITFYEQLENFLDDFRLTACMSLLRQILHELDRGGPNSIISYAGILPMQNISFAIERCNEFVAKCRHEDIDKQEHKVWGNVWEKFLVNQYLFSRKKVKFTDNGEYKIQELQQEIRTALENIAEYWPQYNLDGKSNLWIAKPLNVSKGRDIVLTNNFLELFSLIEPTKECKYVVQKYIETPLLISATKFDIRQWFLVSSVQPLIIWMYRDCYFRFSSKKFDINQLDKSIHLCNFSVQEKNTNNLNQRYKDIPESKLWDSATFRAYLECHHNGQQWDQVIYPGMRQAIVGAMLASQDTMKHRTNSFELYSVDFVVDENFVPWLLEIDACPSMTSTTDVSTRLSSECIEDTIKVIIDRRNNPDADTGKFDLIYKQTQSYPSKARLNTQLRLNGTTIKSVETDENTKTESSSVRCVKNSNESTQSNKMSQLKVRKKNSIQTPHLRVFLIHGTRASYQLAVTQRDRRKYASQLDVQKKFPNLVEGAYATKRKSKRHNDIIFHVNSTVSLTSDVNFQPRTIFNNISKMAAHLRQKKHKELHVLFETEGTKLKTPQRNLIERILRSSTAPEQNSPLDRAAEKVLELKKKRRCKDLIIPQCPFNGTAYPTENTAANRISSSAHYAARPSSPVVFVSPVVPSLDPYSSFNRAMLNKVRPKLIQTLYQRKRDGYIPNNVSPLRPRTIEKHLNHLMRTDRRVPQRPTTVGYNKTPL